MNSPIAKFSLAGLLTAAISCANNSVTESEQPQFYSKPETQALKLPFSEAVRVGDLIFLSGQLGNVPGKLELVPGGIKAETRQTMDNIQSVLSDLGLNLNNLVKCTVFLADMTEWSSFNSVYATYFSGELPARSALGTNGLALGARVEIECVANARSRYAP